MPTPPQPDPTPNGARNVFLDADPVDNDTLTEPSDLTNAPAAPRQRGRVVAVDRPPAIAAARSRAARFTRPDTGIVKLGVRARRRVDRAAVLAGRLLARVAARPYAALTALGVLAGLLIALGWLGLDLRDAAAAHRVTEQRVAAATTTLTHDRARIDALSAQLHQALTARRRLTATTVTRPRPSRSATRTPARDHRRRH